MDYEVNYATLAQAGQRAAMIASDAARPLSQMRLDGVDAAIPGGVSGAVANRIDSMWVDNAKEIKGALDGYSKALTSNAQNYQQIEKAAADAARSFFGSVS